MSDFKKLATILCAGVTLSACGQTGKLYLPGNSGEVTTRSTQTPGEPAGSNSPQTVDSPSAPAPAPDDKKDEKGKQAPPPEPQKN